MDYLKRAGKSVVDAGAKQMLKADIMLLDREINTRKHSFGLEIYDLMAELEAATDGAMSDQDKLAMIRAAYDNVTKDIGIVEAKKDCKREEMKVLEVRSNITALEQANIPPSEGQVIMN